MTIHACSFTLASEIFKNCAAFRELFGETSKFTWGDANRTLIDKDRFAAAVKAAADTIPLGAWDIRMEYTTVHDRLMQIPSGIYVDMEN